MDNTYITQNAEILAKIATIGSFVVAVSALIFSYLQSRFRKHEIKRAYYCEVLEWYSKTISILSNLNYCLKNSHAKFAEKRDQLLPMLSTQIEIGRFYFPNKKNGYYKENLLRSYLKFYVHLNSLKTLQNWQTWSFIKIGVLMIYYWMTQLILRLFYQTQYIQKTILNKYINKSNTTFLKGESREQGKIFPHVFLHELRP